MPTANSSASKEAVTAALLVIGGKILSGRTKDQNIGYVAECLTAVGIDLKEVRVVGNEDTLANARRCRPTPKSALFVIAITSRVQSAALVLWSSIVNVTFDGSS
jgi:hypothetical protein